MDRRQREGYSKSKDTTTSHNRTASTSYNQPYTVTSYNQPYTVTSYYQPYTTTSYNQPYTTSYNQSASTSYNQPASTSHDQPSTSTTTSSSTNNNNYTSPPPHRENWQCCRCSFLFNFYDPDNGNARRRCLNRSLPDQGYDHWAPCKEWIRCGHYGPCSSCNIGPERATSGEVLGAGFQSEAGNGARRV